MYFTHVKQESGWDAWSTLREGGSRLSEEEVEERGRRGEEVEEVKERGRRGR